MLCPALDGLLYACHLRTGNFRQAKLPDPAAEVSACAALDQTTALMAGGQGTGLLFVNATDLTVTKRSLSEWGVSKPGRQVHTMSRVGARVYLGGAKGLLAVYENGAARELTARPTFAAGEVLISSIAALAEDVYVAGYSSATGHALFVVRDKVAQSAELPFPTSHQHGFGLRNWGDDLLVYADTIHRGLPGRWTRWGGDFTAPDIAAVEPMPGAESLCVIRASGRSFLLTRRGATELSDVQ